MLKRLTARLLVFSVLTVNYSRLFVYAGFKLNQTYIAAKLCENRNKPLFHCNGKCYLMKKIRQAEEKQNNAESRAQKSLFQDVCCVSDISHLQAHNYDLTVIGFPHLRNCGKLPTAYLTIFHPPQLG